MFVDDFAEFTPPASKRQKTVKSKETVNKKAAEEKGEKVNRKNPKR